MHTLKNSLSEHVWVIGRLTLGRPWGIKSLDRIAPNIFSITIIKQQPLFTMIICVESQRRKATSRISLFHHYYFIWRKKRTRYVESGGSDIKKADLKCCFGQYKKKSTKFSVKAGYGNLQKSSKINNTCSGVLVCRLGALL